MAKEEANLDNLRVPLIRPRLTNRNKGKEIIEEVSQRIKGKEIIEAVSQRIKSKEINEEDRGFRVDKYLELNLAICHLRIEGMTCRSCADSVERALLMIGVERTVVSLETEEAKIYFDPNLISKGKILQAIEDAGLGAELIRSTNVVNKVHLKLEGVNSEDVAVVRPSLEVATGVDSVDMDLSGQKVIVRYDPDQTCPKSLIQCIKEAGQGLKTFSASLYVPPKRRDIEQLQEICTEQLQEIRTSRNLSVQGFLFSIPVFLFAMVLPMLPPYGTWLDYKVQNMLTVGMLFRWILCTPVQFIFGRRFYCGSYHALRQNSADMNVLVALGTNAAYFYSTYVVIRSFTSNSFKGQDFFETSSMLISFILFGKYLEAMAKGKMSDALTKLAALAPDAACLVKLDGSGSVLSEMETDAQLIKKNDLVKVVPGAKFPVDGIVIHGQSSVNESMITGESRSFVKAPGGKVIAGTTNENGCLLVKATHVGSDTALSKIVQLVESAQLAQVSTQKLADQMSKYFVPVILVVAWVTWLAWFISGEAGIYPKRWIPIAMDEFELALQFGISVLVIACPCAFRLATPTAVMVALGKGASQGVLIKSGTALENAHKVKAVVFDKTETIIAGEPEVVSAVLFSNFTMDQVCEAAIAAESNIDHPFAKPLVKHANRVRRTFGYVTSRTINVEQLMVFPRAGIAGKFDKKRVLVGSKKFLETCRVPVGPAVDRYIFENEQLARTCILVAINGKVAGGFAIDDPLKPETERVLSCLHSMGIKSIMATGDSRVAASAIAKRAGFDLFLAEADPAKRADKIRTLQERGIVVAMVGDKRKDSAGLAAAKVGVAIGTGTDVVVEAADIVVMRNNLESVVTALHLSRMTIWRIRLNYLWALGYNIVGVPIAAGILYPFAGIRLPPLLAGACMVASSLVVVSSSLLLHCYCRPWKIRST